MGLGADSWKCKTSLSCSRWEERLKRYCVSAKRKVKAVVPRAPPNQLGRTCSSASSFKGFHPQTTLRQPVLSRRTHRAGTTAGSAAATSADLLEGCIAEGGLAADGGDARLLQLEHDGPAAQRVALGHRAHRAAAARQVLPRQRRVQAAQPTCRGQGLGLGLGLSSEVHPCRPAGAPMSTPCTGRVAHLQRVSIGFKAPASRCSPVQRCVQAAQTAGSMLHLGCSFRSASS